MTALQRLSPGLQKNELSLCTGRLRLTKKAALLNRGRPMQKPATALTLRPNQRRFIHFPARSVYVASGSAATRSLFTGLLNIGPCAGAVKRRLAAVRTWLIRAVGLDPRHARGHATRKPSKDTPRAWAQLGRVHVASGRDCCKRACSRGVHIACPLLALAQAGKKSAALLDSSRTRNRPDALTQRPKQRRFSSKRTG